MRIGRPSHAASAPWSRPPFGCGPGPNWDSAGRRDMAEGVVQERLLQDRSLPVGSANKRSVGWWGVIGLIGTEASLFAYLLFTYFYVTLNITTAWPPDGPPDFK